jgi:hypothetical protein
MRTPTRSTILLIILLFFIAAGVIFFVLDSFGIKLLKPAAPTEISATSSVPNTSTSNQDLVVDYPLYLIEGPIQNISDKTTPAKVTIAVKLASIFIDPEAESADTTCDLEKDAVITSFNPENNQEKPIALTDLKVNDQVVAELTGNSSLSILEGASCLIHKIRLMIPVLTPGLLIQ